MSFSSSSGAAFANKVPVRFHQIREGESLGTVASKYNIEIDRLTKSNPGAEKTGDIVVIDLRLQDSSII